MRNATRVTVSTFGVLASLAGIEHGVGEILQGNTFPGSVMILSWPESALFQTLNGEPAMTVIPNLLASGILTVLVSLAFLVWVTGFVQRNHGIPVLFALSVVLLLVGGGFGPPLLGLILGAAGTRINPPLTSRTADQRSDLQAVLARLWPWSFAAGLAAWLLLLPGLSILSYFFGVDSSNLTFITILCAFGFLVLTIFAGFARGYEEITVSNNLLRRV